MDDGYIGSGKQLWNSINKHGKDNHKIEILEFLPDRESLKVRERELVNEDTLKDPMCMNLIMGGIENIWDLNNPEHVEKLRRWSTAGGKASAKSPIAIEAKKKAGAEAFKKAKLRGTLKIPSFTGLSHTDATKQKMSEIAKTWTGEKNSQFGTCWVTKDGINKKILLTLLNDHLSDGWTKGRKLK